jgi:hypothetical protein
MNPIIGQPLMPTILAILAEYVVTFPTEHAEDVNDPGSFRQRFGLAPKKEDS